MANTSANNNFEFSVDYDEDSKISPSASLLKQTPPSSSKLFRIFLILWPIDADDEKVRKAIIAKAVPRVTADLAPGGSEVYSSVRSPDPGSSPKRRRLYKSTQKIVSKNEKTYVNIVESYKPVKKRAISLRNNNS